MRAANRRSASAPRSDSRGSPPLTGIAVRIVGDTVLDDGRPPVRRASRVRPAPDGGDVAERGVAGAPRIALVVHIRRPQNRLDSGLEASHTANMVDPLVAALAQLVRDRWSAEWRERTAAPARMRVLEGEE